MLKTILKTVVACTVLSAGASFAAPVAFQKLSGATGTTPNTAVYKADLSQVGLGTIQSVSIRDNSSGLGGSPGAHSGFDLDAIKLSTTDCSTAECAASAAYLSVFDFLNGATFTPGSQRAPVASKLYGTGPTGDTIDNTLATLGLFDGVSNVNDPFGYLSLGDAGTLSFNFTEALSTAGLYLYIGEVGDNGEVAASSIVVNENQVPEPGTLALTALALAGIVQVKRRRA